MMGKIRDSDAFDWKQKVGDHVLHLISGNVWQFVFLIPNYKYYSQKYGLMKGEL